MFLICSGVNTLSNILSLNIVSTAFCPFSLPTLRLASSLKSLGTSLLKVIRGISILSPSPKPGGLGNGLSSAGNSSTRSMSGITASPVLYAEGGGGANYCNPSSPPGLSQGSGGNAGYGPYPSCNTTGGTGTVNTGGGGGGGSNANSGGPTSNGGAGGSGIVIIRYKFQ